MTLLHNPTPTPAPHTTRLPPLTNTPLTWPRGVERHAGANPCNEAPPHNEVPGTPDGGH
ncbi:hypothetical protein ACIRQY_17965 [Streptomyces sp. NPDC101490]|uniref:hypothetical protein n=1 Tax=Streptomyces sp. NPDC101490 TaxID=3366143 RepID=UPI0038230843